MNGLLFGPLSELCPLKMQKHYSKLDQTPKPQQQNLCVNPDTLGFSTF